MAVSVSTAPVEQPDDSAPIPFSLTPAAEALAQQGRMVPARIAGALVVIPCPAWCTVDHVEQDARWAEDVYHAGESIALTAPGMTGPVEIASAWLSQYPFSSGDSSPYLAFDAAGDGAISELGRAAILAHADQMAAHADRLRALAASLPDDAPRPPLPRRRPGATNPPSPRA